MHVHVHECVFVCVSVHAYLWVWYENWKEELCYTAAACSDY